MKLIVEFTRERETPNKIRFKEVEVEGQEEISGMLYITKKSYTALGKPKTLKVTIEEKE